MTQKNQSLVSHTVERLLYILTEEQAFQPGERLPNEVKLAAHHAMEIHLHHIVDALNLNCGKYKLY